MVEKTWKNVLPLPKYEYDHCCVFCLLYEHFSINSFIWREIFYYFLPMLQASHYNSEDKKLFVSTLAAKSSFRRTIFSTRPQATLLLITNTSNLTLWFVELHSPSTTVFIEKALKGQYGSLLCPKQQTDKFSD